MMPEVGNGLLCLLRNPDQFARELVAATGCDQTAANAAAWAEGMRRLDEAVSTGRSFAFETTLGGYGVAARLKAASSTHDVLMWFCGLASPELHIARVQARVAAGGHAIPEAKIRERWTASIANLIALAGASDSIRARQQAEEVLYQPTPIQAGIDLPLTPDIAAALGIKAVNHE